MQSVTIVRISNYAMIQQWAVECSKYLQDPCVCMQDMNTQFLLCFLNNVSSEHVMGHKYATITAFAIREGSSVGR